MDRKKKKSKKSKGENAEKGNAGNAGWPNVLRSCITGGNGSSRNVSCSQPSLHRHGALWDGGSI